MANAVIGVLRRGLAGAAWVVAAAAQAQVSVLFEVDLRAEIAAGRFEPERDTVGLRGALAPLSWQKSIPLAPAGSGLWAVTVRFEQMPFGGQPLPHKFRIERPGQGADEGWEPGPNRFAHLDPARPHVSRAFGAPSVPPLSSWTGNVMALDTVPSRHVTPRPVWVWLPPGYERDDPRRYPVLYLNDGQNVFDPSSSGAEWQVDEAAQRLVLGGAIAPMIVVAIPSGRDRLFEYTPTAMLLEPRRSGQSAAAMQGGGAPAYTRFLIDELKPLIDQRFRTLTVPGATAVGGSSLGGLLALWLALHHGDTFGAALVVSPSVWWDDEFAARDVRSSTWAGGARPRLWLDVGGQEGEGAVPAVRRLRDTLLRRGWSEDGPAPTLHYGEHPEARHDELSWAARVEGMLRFLYGAAPSAAASPSR